MTIRTNSSDEKDQSEKMERLNENIAKMDILSKRLMHAMGKKQAADPGLQGPSTDVYLKAATAYMSEIVANPSKMIERQVSYWSKTLAHFSEMQDKVAKAGSGEEAEPKKTTDRRFQSELWEQNPYFSMIKQHYLYSSEAITDAVRDLEGIDEKDKTRVEFFTRQVVDMIAPTNFLGTNPEALQRALDTDGQSLVLGLENLVRDIETNSGDLLVGLADEEAFTLGENIATAEGSVVYRNRMFELIQYAPTTETVHKTPLIIFPPWINKFYIMDLKPQNSLIRWAVDQGFTLFVVSWVNPTEDHADVGMDTYIEEGYFAAIEAVKEITGEPQVNVIGYCIAGTMLSICLGLLEKRGDKSVKSATFFTMLTDFEDPGEMAVFLDDDFVDGIERQVGETGYLHSFFMSRTFSYLRANDLVYAPAVRNYMMGEKPPAFDLLYWNSDSTNLPGRFVVEYLRKLCQKNELAKGTFKIMGETLSLKDVKVPVCAIACETDHIAAWKGSFNGLKQFGSREKSFIVSESGHVAGIINPPTKKKYGHYTGSTPKGSPDGWMDAAAFNEGSWWPTWREWVGKKSGKQVAARAPGAGKYPVLEASPGTYVRKLKAK